MKRRLLRSSPKQAFLSLRLINVHSLSLHFQEDNFLWVKRAIHSYLCIFTTTDAIAEPVPPIHEDLVFQQSKRFFFRVYILRYLNKCLCVPATFEVKPNNILISNYESLQLTSVFGLIDFIVHFISPVKRKLRVLFSIRSSILIFSINIYILLLLWYDKFSLHPNQWQDSTEFKSRISSTVTENKALSSLQFQKRNNPF